MKKKKICIVVNSRANYARIKSVLYHAKKSKKIELQIVIGASALLDRYGDLNRILRKDGFKVSRSLYHCRRFRNKHNGKISWTWYH